MTTESFPDVFQAISATSVNPVLVIDEVGDVLFVNQALKRLISGSDGDYVGRTFVDVIHPDDLSAAEDAIARARGSRDSSTFECRLLHRSGHWLAVECVLRFVEIGPSTRGVIHVRDLADRLQLLARLRHAQKLTSLGQLSTGVAEDLTQLVATLHGQIERLNTDEAPTPFTLQSIRRSVERAGALARQMRVFAETAAIPSERVDLHNLVGDLRRAVSGEMWLDLLLEAQRPVVRTDRRNLNRALRDLVFGFHDVMPKGSVLSITTRNIALTARPGQADLAVEYVAVDVANTARGLPVSANRELFEPAGPPPATGAIMLALVVLHDLATASGGFVEVAANSNGATTVGIYLPVS